MAKKLTKAHLEITLDDVAEATEAGEFLYTPVGFHTEYVTAGVVETNPAMTDEYGCVATRMTDKGFDYLNELTNNSPEVEPEPAPEDESAPAEEEVDEPEVESKPMISEGFVIETVESIPVRQTRRAGPEKYPFSELGLESNNCIKVPVTPENREAVSKEVSAAVTRANKKYSEVVLGQYKTSKSGKKVPLRKSIRKFITRYKEGNMLILRVL